MTPTAPLDLPPGQKRSFTRDPGLDALIADPRTEGLPRTLACHLVLKYANGKDVCFPSDKALAADLGKHPTAVNRALRVLRVLGYVAATTVRRWVNGFYLVRRYLRLLWRCTYPGAGAKNLLAPAPGSQTRHVARAGPGPVRPAGSNG